MERACCHSRFKGFKFKPMVVLAGSYLLSPEALVVKTVGSVVGQNGICDGGDGGH